jgi:hypothetical protein
MAHQRFRPGKVAVVKDERVTVVLATVADFRATSQRDIEWEAEVVGPGRIRSTPSAIADREPRVGRGRAAWRPVVSQLILFEQFIGKSVFLAGDGVLHRSFKPHPFLQRFPTLRRGIRLVNRRK